MIETNISGLETNAGATRIPLNDIAPTRDDMGQDFIIPQLMELDICKNISENHTQEMVRSPFPHKKYDCDL